MRSPIARNAVRLAALLLAVALLSALSAWMLLRASMPALDGMIAMPGLTAPVEIRRDVRGRPTISAENREDAARALGFLHAQERFFQMDLSRRAAAGELSALLGEATLALDRSRRMHRLRALARRVVAAADAADLSLLQAYADGVNHGVDELAARPMEYWLLGVSPERWLPEDTLLVVYAMYFDLTDERADRDAMMTALSETYPRAYFEFLAQDGTGWDAPMVGEPRAPMAVPAPEVYRLPEGTTAHRPGLAGRSLARSESDTGLMVGSNNWAVHGSRTASGSALLANDMHLGLRVPNTWYFARLITGQADDPGRHEDVAGVTLPGAFGVIAGSNGHLAWGFTNSYGDWSDRILLETDPDHPLSYRTAEGFESFVDYEERIEVKGQADVLMTVQWTRWGPVVGRDHRGRLQALKWLAHEPEAANLRIVQLAGVRSVQDALVLASQIGAPPQNFVAADRRGNIGWTIMGRIPVRAGYDPRLAASWADGKTGWRGWLAAADYPRIVNPAGGQIWTANARVASGPWLDLIGDGGYDLGARAAQIRDQLRALPVADESRMLDIQLDDRALFLDRWHALLLALLDEGATAGNPERAELRAVVAAWTPRAAVDEAGFRMVRAWRQFFLDEVFSVLTSEAAAAAPDIRFYNRQWEGPAWQLVEARPRHLLPLEFTSWDDWMLHVADETVDYFKARFDGPLESRVWGERNRVRVRHPISGSVPLLSSLLDMPVLALPGDNNMPRVQSPGEGASQRMAVTPGREVDGYFHMPAGQSGHPLSPFYDSEHLAWARGEPVPFLPGDTGHTLVLSPAEADD